MVQINMKNDVSISLNKIMELIFPKKEKYINEKIIFYLRIYTDLVKAESGMTPAGLKRMVDLLRIVRNMARNHDFREEEAYAKRIGGIVQGIIENVPQIKKLLKNPDEYDPMHAKTKLQLAQNICILRILRRETG